MKLTGAQAIWESLVNEGVDVVFGILGASVIHLYHTMPDYPIHHVLVRHEQAAAHAADGYARATGRVGVCIATSGPGATNLVTGLATAYMDSSPVVAITGQVPMSLIGTDAFQEVDITGITMPITKHNYLVTDVRDLPATIKEAFHIARTGRPGPVLIDIPKDVQAATLDYDYPATANLPSYHLPRPAAPSQIQQAARMINEAERPVIVAGHGVILAGVEEGVRALVEKGTLPLVTTLLGICTLPGSHPLCLGMAGMHGEAYANKALTEADVIVSLGSRFDDRLTGPTDKFREHAKIVHIDVDPVEINKTVPSDLAIVGDLRDVLPALSPLVETKDRSAWLARIQEWRSESARHDILTQDTEALVPQYIIHQLWEATQGKAIVVSDVGQNQMWEAQYYDHQLHRGLLTSGGLGTMGFALPAAVGAKLGCPDQPVWVVAGDGGFQMNIQELATVVQEQLPIKVVLLNNGFLGMVRQWQQLFFERRYSGTPLSGPDFARLAEAYGIEGVTVQEKSEVIPAFARAMATPGPMVLDFRIAQEENVYPMVTPGGSISSMLRRPIVSEQPSASY
ncbi:MAG: biosynthetic-type acetolactate synthase large subunit [Anaerolineae bacterium]|jgi:acetolactate synthase-1/2/3 large subunit|nr:biosynthetic-type acetolactate synthase large subunit [Anaerolineae bacterium]